MVVVCSGGMEAQLQPFFHGNFPVLIRPTSRLETLHGKEVGAVMNAVTVGTLTIIISRQTQRYFQPNYINIIIIIIIIKIIQGTHSP